MARSALMIVLALVSGCDQNKIDWVQFNTDGDILRVDVGATTESPQEDHCTEQPSLCEGQAGCICLRSSLRSKDVGTASVSPSFGPVGTRHEVRVTMLDAYEEIVYRATVLPMGRRSTEDTKEIELRQDSADPGSWLVELESLGAVDEQREDTFEIYLWEPDGAFSAETTTTTTGAQ